jgi:hypothetical protein
MKKIEIVPDPLTVPFFNLELEFNTERKYQSGLSYDMFDNITLFYL